MKNQELMAKKYIERYRTRIANKFTGQKKNKELLNTMDIDNKEKEWIDKKYKEELLAFVHKLQSDKSYEKMKEIYHNSMQKVHKLNKAVHDYTDADERAKMGEHTKNTKEIFFKSSPEKWESFITTSYWRFRDKLWLRDREKILKESEKMMSNKEYFDQKISEIKAFLDTAPGEIIRAIVLLGWTSWLSFLWSTMPEHTITRDALLLVGIFGMLMTGWYYIYRMGTE